MDNPVLGVFAVILFLAALKVLVPVAVQMVDGIVLAVIRAPFRWIANRWRTRSQQSPYQRGLRRASEGAFIATGCIYSASWFPTFLNGNSVFDLIAAFTRSPTDCPGAAVWVIAVVIGLLWTVTGLRSARGGDRDPMSALYAAGIAGACIALLWWHVFPSPDRTFATLLEIASLKTFYVATAAAGLVRLWLTMPLPNPAMAAVNRVIRERNAPMVGAGAGRRRFFFR
jgi:hypothetical protein